MQVMRNSERDKFNLDSVDHEIRMTRIQLSRALHAEAKAARRASFLLFTEIIDDLIGRIEALELARMYLRRAARLDRGAL
jgi:hypothetical protein